MLLQDEIIVELLLNTEKPLKTWHNWLIKLISLLASLKSLFLSENDGLFQTEHQSWLFKTMLLVCQNWIHCWKMHPYLLLPSMQPSFQMYVREFHLWVHLCKLYKGALTTLSEWYSGKVCLFWCDTSINFVPSLSCFIKVSNFYVLPCLPLRS